jgi:hypothetical protein
MSEINERLFEIQKMIEVLIKKEDTKDLKEVYQMLDWKRGCHQEEIRKLDDIFYFLSGVLFSQGITCSWGRTEFIEKELGGTQ